MKTVDTQHKGSNIIADKGQNNKKRSISTLHPDKRDKN
jgi:hypothetical protein